ncbi:MAG: hypothetical protein NTW21_01775 [Verrucomicrobia bacterium]|nr:hypothetical protein [Verrucomicrobiota bacterium]
MSHSCAWITLALALSPILCPAETLTEITYTVKLGQAADGSDATLVAEGLTEPFFKWTGDPASARYVWVRNEKTLQIHAHQSGFFETDTWLKVPATVFRGELAPVRVSFSIRNPSPFNRFGDLILRVIEEDRGTFGTAMNVEDEVAIGRIDLGPGGLVPGPPPALWQTQQDRLLNISGWEANWPSDTTAEVRAEGIFSFGGQDLTWPFGTDIYTTDPIDVQIVEVLSQAPKPSIHRVADGLEIYWAAATARSRWSPSAFSGQVVTVTTESSPASGGMIKGAGSFSAGSVVWLSATAAPGYRFTRWEGPGIAGGLRTRNPLDITVAANATFRAVFTELRKLVVRCEPEGAGNPSGAGLYDLNGTATIRNVTNPGFHFVRWEGAPVMSPTSETTTIVMDQNYTVTAIYESLLALTTASFPPGAGTAGGGGFYQPGTWVAIVAAPIEGFVFAGWAGEGIEDPTLPSTRVLVDAHKTVTATFGGGVPADVEYFVDIDPGIGFATPMAMDHGGAVFNVDTSELSPGVHVVGVRSANLEGDLAGVWGHTRYRWFEVRVPEELPPGPTALEYVIDGSIEFGPRNRLVLPGEGFSFYPVGGPWAPGVHRMDFRLDHGANYYSPNKVRYFTVLPPDPACELAEMEYFVEDDPGIGNGRKIPVTAGFHSVTTFEPPASILRSGVNRIGIRARNADGVWGLPAVRYLTLLEPDQPSGIGGVSAYLMDGTNRVPGTQTGIFLPNGDTASGSFHVDTHNLQEGRTYSLWVEALSAEGIPAMPVTRDIVVLAAASVGAAYQAWVRDSGHFPGTDADDLAICGFLADPDGDGIPNGSEYAFGTNPRDASSRFQPTAETQDGHLIIRYRQRKGGDGSVGTDYTAAGVRYTVQYAENLAPETWRMGSEVVEVVGASADNGDGTETVTVRSKTPVAAAPRGFLRVYLELR